MALREESRKTGRFFWLVPKNEVTIYWDDMSVRERDLCRKTMNSLCHIKMYIHYRFKYTVDSYFLDFTKASVGDTSLRNTDDI